MLMKRRTFIFRSLASLALLLGLEQYVRYKGWFLSGGYGAMNDRKANREYYRILVLGDPHLPVRERETKDIAMRQRIIQAKEEVIKDINEWQDVEKVAVVGDIAAQFGTKEEYEAAKTYLANIQKPLAIVTGNHDYMYADGFSPSGHFIKADRDLRARKLQQFKEQFLLESLYYSYEAGPYHLIFLSPDSLDAPHLTQMSAEQLGWLEQDLQAHREAPTVIFFHAPLDGTLRSYNKMVNQPDFIAQPAAPLDSLLRDNQQIKLWVSGHTHTPATNPSYADRSINIYKDTEVLVIHNADMDREKIWTNSIYLYPDKIVVRTFNHADKCWEDALERSLLLACA